MSLPTVSVVMGVYNGAPELPRTLNSVLTQHGVDLEFIIVNDGSTDQTGALLDEAAQRDSRLRVLHQVNGGLTDALVNGCALARGEFIARQDAGGDLSLPGRLTAQVALLRAHPDAILASCATRFVTAEGDWLFDEVIPQDRLDSGLRTLDISSVCGPSSHPSCLFRREAYERVGGYRRPFVLAQDLDLWLRMIEAGRFIAMHNVFYQAVWNYGGLTSRLRPEQRRYARVALEAARCRRAGLPEPALLKPSSSLAIVGATSRHAELSRFHYFVGSCLASRHPRLATKHFRSSFTADPRHLRAILRWLALRLYFLREAELLPVALDYLRATLLRARGSELAPKVRIGAGVTITRPSALSADSRVVVEPGVVFKLVGSQARLHLGSHVFVGRGTQFDLSGELIVGDNTMFAPGCFITDHNHGIANGIPMWRQPIVNKQVRIGADCWLGARSILLPGVTIGDGAVVAAGAVVTGNVAAGSIVAGVPARFQRMR